MLNEDQCLAVTSKRSRRRRTSDLSRQLSAAIGTTDSKQTVNRRLGHMSICSWASQVCSTHGNCVPFVWLEEGRCQLRHLARVQNYEAWERVTLFGGVKETHSPNSVSCKQQEQGRCKNYSCNFRDRRPPIT
ncbi:hypothetical protein TNCV_2827971 [Trichonephila clavipes]|nr:hypothetical protein TNCV_2827971 [Trichonephila clavipes]